MRNITCDKEKKNEMKTSYAHAHECLDDPCAHEMQMPNAMLNTRVLQTPHQIHARMRTLLN